MAKTSRHRRGKARRRFDPGEPISRIDTRPMVFVAVFMAVVFLFPAAKAQEHALMVELPPPHSDGYLAPLSPPSNLLLIEPDGTLRWNGVSVSEGQLREVLRSTTRLSGSPTLLFEPDGTLPYGEAARVLNIVREEGALSGCFIFKDIARYRRYEVPATLADPVEHSPRDCGPGPVPLAPPPRPALPGTVATGR